MDPRLIYFHTKKRNVWVTHPGNLNCTALENRSFERTLSLSFECLMFFIFLFAHDLLIAFGFPMRQRQSVLLFLFILIPYSLALFICSFRYKPKIYIMSTQRLSASS